MERDEPKETPKGLKQAKRVENGQNVDGLFSPRFKSVAAMAGWDEEALIIATLVVEDTPDRESKHKRRSGFLVKSPPSTNSRSRKRRSRRLSPGSPPVAILILDEEDTLNEDGDKKKMEEKIIVTEEKKTGAYESNEAESCVSCSEPALPCMDKLREELSCAICLEICFEPSTTPCGHSFCKKCLRSAADKCGKRCPKCRQLISNGRSCTVNTVLWNTIQLLFPQEVEARKAGGASTSQDADHQTPETTGTRSSSRSRSIRPPSVSSSSRDGSSRRRGVQSQDVDTATALRIQREDLSRLVSTDSSPRRRRGTPSQDEDAALALRLQREEFMDSFGRTHQQSRTSISLARANLRAMASRAMNIRMRSRAT